ncbi:hypothetical protein BP6252_10038 [Coleophoma cylindrospora]|uniref:JmjC domain-containing protein n=1 Tax=Coleophoma cylindrospora TaxID=1849047 RepID=A0A3D8QX48_9HELO|nr:hypothetical protein BP6252_10038 [Coleophoma cylindrospora]
MERALGTLARLPSTRLACARKAYSTTARSRSAYAEGIAATGKHNVRCLPPVQTLAGTLDQISIEDFRSQAFVPELPIHIIAAHASAQVSPVLPAASKWFKLQPSHTNSNASMLPSREYLSAFGTTTLPYETTIERNTDDLEAICQALSSGGQEEQGSSLEAFMYDFAEQTNQIQGQGIDARHTFQFCRFNAPLNLFLEAFGSRNTESPQIRSLYIAQAQIADLPKQLQDDLPTPELVKKAGRGDIYDTSIWMGIPPTYTPLHKDPNPNLFVQMAGRKIARLYKPSIGSAIFRDVQTRIGGSSSYSFRGLEMMQGLEVEVLEEAVWGPSCSVDGYEVEVNPGDALFIPKGWWHSIKSLNKGTREVNASVNWWFR